MKLKPRHLLVAAILATGAVATIAASTLIPSNEGTLKPSNEGSPSTSLANQPNRATSNPQMREPTDESTLKPSNEGTSAPATTTVVLGEIAHTEKEQTPTEKKPKGPGKRLDPNVIARSWAVDTSSWESTNTGADTATAARRWIADGAVDNLYPPGGAAAADEPIGTAQAAWVQVDTTKSTRARWTGNVTITLSPGTTPGQPGPEGETLDYDVTATRGPAGWAISDVEVSS